MYVYIKLNLCPKFIGRAHMHCPIIGRNADDWTVVIVSAQNGTSAATFAGETHHRI